MSTPQAPGAPSPTAAPSAAEIEAELDALARDIEAGLSLAGQGEMLELTGIDRRIEVACRAAQALPPAEAKVLVDRLGQLVGLLDRLAAELLHQFGNLPKDTETLPRVAADAYGKTSGGQG